MRLALAIGLASVSFLARGQCRNVNTRLGPNGEEEESAAAFPNEAY